MESGGSERAPKATQADDQFEIIYGSVEPRYRQRFTEIVQHTDAVCMNHLTPLHREYQVYCYLLAGACCKDGFPVVEGRAKPEGWAAAVLWTLGVVNFLSDPSFEPVMTGKEVAKEFGVSVGNMQSKSREIRDSFGIIQFDPRWTLPSLAAQNPLVWMLETEDGLVIDIRTRPREEQVWAYDEGLIPYVPADAQYQSVRMSE